MPDPTTPALTAAGPPPGATAPGAATGLDRLYLPGNSRLHGMAAAPKIVAVLTFLFVVVATGPDRWPAFAGYAGLMVALVLLSRVPLAVLARRLLVELPFVVFALALPFLAAGPRVQLGPVPVSEAGLTGAGLLLAKMTLGVLAAALLAATTRAQDLLLGLQQLRLPRPLVAIAGFMVRYAGVVADDLHRMRTARRSRAFAGGPLAHARLEARGIGNLFVRSYGRGERVHQAMLARGYQGRMPVLVRVRTGPQQWLAAASLPALGLLVRTLAG